MGRDKGDNNCEEGVFQISLAFDDSIDTYSLPGSYHKSAFLSSKRNFKKDELDPFVVVHKFLLKIGVPLDIQRRIGSVANNPGICSELVQNLLTNISDPIFILDEVYPRLQVKRSKKGF